VPNLANVAKFNALSYAFAATSFNRVRSRIEAANTTQSIASYCPPI